MFFTCTDSRASLPNDYTFVAGDNGVHSFTVTLKSTGTQTIRARDTKDSSITGTASTNVA